MDPNFELFLWVLLISALIKNISLVVAGAMSMEIPKWDEYHVGHTVIGLIWVMLIMYILLA